MMYASIQRTIILTINQPQFEAALPPLSDKAWASLLAPRQHSHDENERLEFLGDALMYATIGRMLYAQIPDGSPHLYTNLRAALHSNATFSHLAEKLDILAVSSSVLRALTIRNFGEGAAAPMLKSKPEIKATADLFETVIGAYYLERGFEALCDWVKDIYKPLITAAQKTFHECQASHSRNKRRRLSDHSEYSNKPARLRKRLKVLRSPVKRKASPLRSKINLVNRGQIPLDATRENAASATIVNKAASLIVGRNTLTRNTPTRRTPVSATRGSARTHRKPIVIDLTLDSDTSDDDDDIPITVDYGPAADRHVKPLPSRSTMSPARSNNDRVIQPHICAEANDDDDSSEDESMLEQMLSMMVDSRSDMSMDSDYS